MKKRPDLLYAFLLAGIPIISSLIYCALQGHGIWQLFLPDSGWNDELMYYKMVEAVLDYGMPKGYFGFMEQHAQYFSFAAWSPVIMIQWVLWGAVFGWNLYSPYLSNIAFLAICFWAFGMLARPSRKQTLWLAGLFMLLKPLTRYTLSCVPEVEMFGLMLLYLGLCIRLERDKEKRSIGKWMTLYLVLFLMTLIRPYMILFYVSPCIIWFRKGSRKDKVLSLVITAVTVTINLVCYALISHFLSAPYFEPLFSTTWIQGFLEKGFLGGARQMVSIAGYGIRQMLQLILGCLSQNAYYAAGLYYLLSIVALVSLGIWLIIKVLGFIKRRSLDDEEGLIILLMGQILVALGAFLVADILMYRIEPGGRHTLVFLVGILSLIPFLPCKKRNYGCYGMLFLPFVFLIWGNIPYEYELSYDDGTRVEQLVTLSEQLEEGIVLTDEIPSYDNTVLWVYDVDSMNYSEYYALPSGCGINFVFSSYVLDNWDALQAKYLGVTKGCGIIPIIEEQGAEYIGGNDKISFYKVRE